MRRMDVYEIRTRNLLALVAANRASGRKDKDFAQRAGGLVPSHLSQLKAGKKMGDDIARSIDAGLGKPRGWMDSPHWEEIGPATSGVREPEPSRDGRDALSDLVDELWVSQGILAQALAATIPTAGRGILEELRLLPDGLRNRDHLKALAATVRSELASQDVGALRGAARKARGSRSRKRA